MRASAREDPLHADAVGFSDDEGRAVAFAGKSDDDSLENLSSLFLTLYHFHVNPNGLTRSLMPESLSWIVPLQFDSGYSWPTPVQFTDRLAVGRTRSLRPISPKDDYSQSAPQLLRECSLTVRKWFL